MKPLLLLAFLLITTSFASAQTPKCPVMPQGTLCLTQEQANAAAANAREVPVLRQAVDDLKAQLIEKDKIADGIRATAVKNENDLKAIVRDADVKMATATGQIIECRADKTMYTSLIEYLTKNQRSKQNGLINIKLWGN